MAAERERLIAAERERLLAELAFATLDLGTSGTWAERWSALLSELRARGDDLTRLDQQRRQAAGRIAALESDLSDVTRERDARQQELEAILAALPHGSGWAGRPVDEWAGLAVEQRNVAARGGRRVLEAAWMARFDLATLILEQSRAVARIGRVLEIPHGEQQGFTPMLDRLLEAMGNLRAQLADLTDDPALSQRQDDEAAFDDLHARAITAERRARDLEGALADLAIERRASR